MKEMIYAVGSTTPERFVLSAISQKVQDKEVFDKFKQFGPDVEVELLINGIPLSFTAIVNDWWRRVKDHHEADVREAALKMVTEAGLDPVANALRDAEQAIVNAIEQVTYVNHL